MKFKTLKELQVYIDSKKTIWERVILYPKMNWLRWIIYNLPDVPRDIYDNIKWFIQRGKRGYSDCDVWDFDSYLCKIIKNGVYHLKNSRTGHPIGISSKQWDKYLDIIIKTYTTAEKIGNSDLIYQENFDRKTYNTYLKLYKENKCIKPMTLKECREYEKGWKLFQKFFFNLWD